MGKALILSRNVPGLPGVSESDKALAPRIEVLDGLRGLAIALVLACHRQEYIRQLWPNTSAFGASGFAEKLVLNLWIGVDLFYVLSGFFIANAVLRLATFEPLHFVRGRLTTILPAYYLALLLVAGPDRAPIFLSSALFGQCRFSGLCTSLR